MNYNLKSYVKPKHNADIHQIELYYDSSIQLINKNSCFCSKLSTNDRYVFRYDVLKSFNESVLWLHDTRQNTAKYLSGGEDPRVFYHKGQEFILDNTMSRCRFFQINKPETNYLIPLNGKNFTMLSDDKDLYVCEWLYPLKIYKIIFEGKNILLHEMKCASGNINFEYRGGATPIYVNNRWIGLGHRTYYENEVLKHDPFGYCIFFENNEFNIQHININIKKKNNIVDPCCIYKSGNMYYITSAESQYSWHHSFKNNFETNVYKMVFTYDEEIKEYQ